MNRTSTQYKVRLIDARGPDYLVAMHLALDLPRVSPGDDPHPQVAELLTAARRRSHEGLLLLGVYDVRHLVSACLAVQSPGASAMVYTPSGHKQGSYLDATAEALRILQEAARQRGTALLESLLPPDTPDLRLAFQQAGFRYLTRLLYFRRRATSRDFQARSADDLEWVDYHAESASRFHEAIRRSYVLSLDCPELMGLRTMEQVVAGHRAVGVHDPSLWWVALRAGETVGVLLLSPIPAQETIEVVYIGVAQAARGTGVGDALLGRAVDAGRASRARVLALAVDERNRPARRLYARWGFVETGVREAWIATPLETRG